MLYPELEVGINAPKEHQRIIAKLLIGLGNLFYDRKISLEPLSETMIDEGKTSPVPDIMLFDNNTKQTKVIIEICHTTGVANDIDKVIDLIENHKFGVIEGFVYDYDTGKWLKYEKNKGLIKNNASYCNEIDEDIDIFLKR